MYIGPIGTWESVFFFFTRETLAKTTARYYLTSTRNLLIKSHNVRGCGKNFEKRESLYIMARNASWYCHNGKHYRGSSKIKGSTTIHPSNVASG